MLSEKLGALREPFRPEQVGKLPRVWCPACRDRKCSEHKPRTCRECGNKITTAHLHLDYVGHAEVTDRLLAVDPDWNWEPLSLNTYGLPATDENGGMWIKLTVCGVTRLGYGHAGAKRGGDATKEVIGDAIRNAALRFGVALDLWKKESPAAESEPSREPAGPVLSEEDQRGQLRKAIVAVGKRKRMGIDQVQADFAEWSTGADIRTAASDQLSAYLAFLQGPEDES